VPGSSNLQLNVTPFIPGVGVVNYSLVFTDPNIVAQGTIRVTDGAGNTCTSVVGEGVICDDTDLTPVLFSMDGFANDAYQTGRAIAKYLRKYSGSKTAGSSLVSQLNSLYLSNWDLTWTELPKVDQRNCSNAALCVSVNSIGKIAEYNGAALSMFNINKTLIKKLKASGAPAGLITSLRLQNKKVYQEAQDASANIPAETLSCPVL
jgi:hypothetical protein